MFAEFIWPYAHSHSSPELEVLQAGPTGGSRGRRTPIVFVHGAFVGAWCWDAHFLDYFAERGFHAVAPSLRGHGESAGRERLSHAGIREYVADLSRVVATLNGPPPILVGHSMGALVVQRYLEQHPATAAILLAPVPPQGLMPSTLRMMWGDPMLFTQFSLMQTLGSGVVDPDIARRAVFSERLRDAELADYANRVQPESQRALWEMAFGGSGARPWLVDPRPPIRVIAAEKDALFAPTETRLVAQLWEADWLEMPGMAHAMMLEPDWERVADEILRGLWAAGLH